MRSRIDAHLAEHFGRALGALVGQSRHDRAIMIEHHLDVIKSADYVVGLGPEGGHGGGRVLATGTPETIAATKESHTGRFLKKRLAPA